MRPVAASAIASTVLAQHAVAQREAARPAAASEHGADAAPVSGSLRQYQVLQSRSEPAQRTLAFKMR
ncbi:hypothetical protein OOT46_11635 [Aquabacterium sp. A7-Y]|uniref:hypothetical protein n=1 Tax=Aquabacterium sp. A7-Y TaxID=1349605 RepID=UPI00223DB540|nr:hypothetical protein [Aquabacterium sp. A7-Y]MCW7538492.1 hypothetical protein [Aquabacterium sp. A7-Y]